MVKGRHIKNISCPVLEILETILDEGTRTMSSLHRLSLARTKQKPLVRRTCSGRHLVSCTAACPLRDAEPYAPRLQPASALDARHLEESANLLFFLTAALDSLAC